ncbi:MAG: hypothetical protein Crog4KO_31160 [Crocinitomicaceae bacterium]
MRNFVFILLLLGGMSHGYAQEVELDTALSSNETLHETYLPYYGSEYRVDLNYQYRLQSMAEALRKDTTIHLHIRGHVCCGEGQRLSRLRAMYIYRFMVACGAPTERLDYKGYSNTCPRNWPEKTEEDEAMNRRVDFVIRKLR